MTVPKSIDGYPIVKEIGSGASGVVYQVKLPGRQRYAALKMFIGEMDHAEILRFKREFGAIARCRHSGIVSVYGMGEHKLRPYILMEFVKGLPLDLHIRKGLRDMEPLPLDRIDTLVHSVNQILETLTYLHGRRIVHRDIKPGNLIVTETGEIKLLDFGMAWNPVTKDYANAGGTAGYQAPEMLLQGRIDPRADLYSLGVCIYNIVTGFHPFGTFTSWQELIEKQLNRRYNSMRVLNPGFDESWEYFTSKLMAPEPSERYHSAIQAKVELHRLADLSQSDNGHQDDHGWGLLDSTWMGEESIFSELSEHLNHTNVLVDCSSGSGRTRLLEEFNSRFMNSHSFVSADLKQDSTELWVKKLLSFFSTHSTSDLTADFDVIETFIDKSKEVSEATPEKFRDRFLEAMQHLASNLWQSHFLMLIDNLEAASGLNIKIINTLTEAGCRILATGTSEQCHWINNFKTVKLKTPEETHVSRMIAERLSIDTPLPCPLSRKLLDLSEHRIGRISQFIDSWYLSGDLYYNNQWFLKPPAALKTIAISDEELCASIVRVPDRRRRLPTIERLDREVLRLIAICRSSCSFALISGVFAAREAFLLEVIDRLLRTGWIEERSGLHGITYSFIEERDKNHVHQTMSPFHLKYLHRRCAEILIRMDSVDKDALAEHYSLSDNTLAGLAVIESAATAARDRFDNARALELYQRVIDNIGSAIRDSSELTGGPDGWIYSFAGLSQSILSQSAKNARRFYLSTLQKTRLESFRDRGNIFGRTGEYGEAFDTFQHMLSEARDKGFRQLEGDALRLIGQILFYQRKLNESKKYFHEALSVRESEDDQAGIADCLNALGVLAQQENKLDESMALFQRSLEIKTRLGDERGIVYIKNNIANIYYSQGKLKEALEEFKSSSGVFRHLNDTLGLAYCLYNIGGVAIELERFKEAVVVLEESLSIRQKMQDLQDTGHCLWQLASALIGAGENDAASKRLTEAIEVLEKIGLSDDADSCREMLSSIELKKSH